MPEPDRPDPADVGARGRGLARSAIGRAWRRPCSSATASVARRSSARSRRFRPTRRSAECCSSRPGSGSTRTSGTRRARSGRSRRSTSAEPGRAAGRVVALVSDNDPFTRDWEANADAWEKRLGAEVVVEPGAGHFERAEEPRVLELVAVRCVAPGGARLGVDRRGAVRRAARRLLHLRHTLRVPHARYFGGTLGREQGGGSGPVVRRARAN